MRNARATRRVSSSRWESSEIGAFARRRTSRYRFDRRRRPNLRNSVCPPRIGRGGFVASRLSERATRPVDDQNFLAVHPHPSALARRGKGLLTLGRDLRVLTAAILAPGLELPLETAFQSCTSHHRTSSSWRPSLRRWVGLCSHAPGISRRPDLGPRLSPRTSRATWPGRDCAACATPWPRSAGSAHASPRTSAPPPPA